MSDTPEDHDLALLVDLHLAGARQGPGSAEDTARAIELSGLAGRSGLWIADIGCGTGAATLDLARQLDAHVTAVDLLPDFLSALTDRARAAGLSDRIDTVEASMDALPLAEGRFDAIWSEGAIYTMGFEAGLTAWQRFLAPGGILAVSELTWLTTDRPAELQRHWDEAYPGIATAGTKISQIEAAGLVPIGYFPLPVSSWIDTYYGPLASRFGAFLARHPGDPRARQIVEAERHEIALFERHARHVSYGFYIARLNGP